jgi:hypothetical protein
MKFTKCPVRKEPSAEIRDGTLKLTFTVEPDGFIAVSMEDRGVEMYALVTEREVEKLLGWLTTETLKVRRKN